MPKIDIRRQCYAMASKDGESAEITMYGDVVERVPVNWWTGKKAEGNFIEQDEFLKDLDAVKKCKTVTIRINSYGGDAVVGLLIHNRLRELARDGVKLTCIVDAVAMSAASVIMAACDTVKVNATGLVMIHRCASVLWGYYNADELEEQVEPMRTYDRALAAAYTRKTGLDEETVLGMMSDTTYLTGKDAVSKGFADELIEDAEPVKLAASANGAMLVVNGVGVPLPPGVFAPDFIPAAASEEGAAVSATVNPAGDTTPAVETNTNTPADPGNEGGNPMTLEEIRAQQPELVQQIEASAAQTAVQNERTRLQGIDEVAALFPAELVAEAKYGEHPCSASELALKAAKAAAKAGSKFLSDLTDDAKASGSGDVTPAPAPDDEQQPATNASKEADGYAMAQRLNEMK